MSEIQSLARKIAVFHKTAPDAAAVAGIDPSALALTPALDNFRQMLSRVEAPPDIAALERLRTWTISEHQRVAHMLPLRLAARFAPADTSFCFCITPM